MNHPLPDRSALSPDAHPGTPIPDQADGQANHLTFTTFERPAQPRASIPGHDRPLTVAPLVPEAVLRRHAAFLGTDTRFAAAARLLSALWRDAQGLPAGAQRDPTNLKAPRSKLGSRLTPKAAQAGRTFVDPAITDYARNALIFREPGSVWNEGRLWGNLLSSQALTVNLLAPLALDLNLASAVWRRLLPGFVHTVIGIRLEHSPGRFQDAWFGDGTAFDALLDIITSDGELGAVAIEFKYVEGMVGPAATPRARYGETAAESGLYRDAANAILYRPGFEQLRREHVMAQLMIERGLVARTHFVLIGPRLNRRVGPVAKLYAAELIDQSGNGLRRDGRSLAGFNALTVEALIEAMADAGATDLASKLWARYCDFAAVARTALAPLGHHPPEPTPSGPTAPSSAQPAPRPDRAGFPEDQSLTGIGGKHRTRSTPAKATARPLRQAGPASMGKKTPPRQSVPGHLKHA